MRAVPLHQHLIAQGFNKFVERHRDGPLFYNPDGSLTTQSSARNRAIHKPAKGSPIGYGG